MLLVVLDVQLLRRRDFTHVSISCRSHKRVLPFDRTTMLIRAGLDAEADVRPSSLMAWAGVVVFEETERIEEVARRLGIRSLDTAARFINYDWK